MKILLLIPVILTLLLAGCDQGTSGVYINYFQLKGCNLSNIDLVQTLKKYEYKVMSPENYIKPYFCTGLQIVSFDHGLLHSKRDALAVKIKSQDEIAIGITTSDKECIIASSDACRNENKKMLIIATDFLEKFSKQIDCKSVIHKTTKFYKEYSDVLKSNDCELF